jgi:DNA-binding response OmpR family regulator
MPPSKPEKILIIESDVVFSRQLEDAFKKSGYSSVTVANDAASGLKSIYDILPHAIILGVALPGDQSYEIIDKKVAEPMLAKIPLYFISTQGLPINMTRVPHDAVKEFIVSFHVPPSEIVAKIDAAFGHGEPTAPAAAGTEAQAAANISAKKKLLWVEDDKLIGSILARKLNSSGFELFHAKSGDEALEGLKTFTPDAAVLDLVLPGMSGFDILQKIKQDDRFKKLPAMILSNLSKQSDIERAKALGAQKFLVKASVSLDQIVEEVRGLCR